MEKDLDYAAMRLKRDFRIVWAVNRRGLDLVASGLRRDGVEEF